MPVIKRRIRNVGILTPCLSADQSAAGESSDLHPREETRPLGGGGVMEGWRGNRRRGGKEARRWDRRREERRGGVMMTRRWEEGRREGAPDKNRNDERDRTGGLEG